MKAFRWTIWISVSMICCFIHINAVAQEVPSAVVGLLPDNPKLEDYIAARNILTASAEANDLTAKKIVEENAHLYAEYKKIMSYIARLQQILVELNKQIVQIDQQRVQHEQACADQRLARNWLDDRIRESQDAKAAGIPEGTTDFVRWLESQGVLMGDKR